MILSQLCFDVNLDGGRQGHVSELVWSQEVLEVAGHVFCFMGPANGGAWEQCLGGISEVAVDRKGNQCEPLMIDIGQ